METQILKKFKLKYVNINLSRNLLASQTKNYVNKFSRCTKKYNFSIIEVHNRPIYVKYLVNKIPNNVYFYIFIMIPYPWMVQKLLRKERSY